MKKILTTMLVGALCLSMLPLSAFATGSETDTSGGGSDPKPAAETPSITIDGNIEDWEKSGLSTLSVVGTEKYDGKKVTFYGLVTDEGLYLAADAYHDVYTTESNAWHTSSNFEFFIGRNNVNDDNQFYVSARDIDKNNGVPTLSNPSQMTTIGKVQMVNEELSNQPTKYHTVTEIFLPNELHKDSSNDATSIKYLTTGGATRVGFAWKTPGDLINNSGTGNDTDWWAPLGTHPNNNQNSKTVVTADGVFTIEDYKAATQKTYVERGSTWHYKTETSAAPLPVPGGWDYDLVEYGQEGEAPFGNRAEGSKNTWGTGDGDGSQENAWLYVAKEFTVDDIDAVAGHALYTDMFYDDDIHLYINGTLVYDHSDWNGGYDRYYLAFDASELLVEGKNIISATLHQHTGGYEFDLGLYSEPFVINSYRNMPKYTNVSTADELIEYIEYANFLTFRNQDITKSTSLYLNDNIDVSTATMEWIPFNRYLGNFDGGSHIISNIVFKTDSDKVGNYGLIVKDLANGDNQHGTVRYLTIKDSVLYAPNVKTESDNRGFVGGIAGLVDRGRILNCTADNVTVVGNKYAGGLAGTSQWASDDGPIVKVEDNAVKNSTVIAVNGNAGGLTGRCAYGDVTSFGNYTVENVRLAGVATNATTPEFETQPLVGEKYVEKDVKDLVKGYVQFRNGDGSYDMRFLVEGLSDVWADCKDATMTLTFTKKDATDTKQMTAVMDKAYSSVKACGETKTARDGYSFVGLVITGIANDAVGSVNAAVTLTTADGQSITINLGSVSNLPLQNSSIA